MTSLEGISDAVKRAYTDLPLQVRQAAQVGCTAAAGALALGPVGTIVGAAVGVVGVLYGWGYAVAAALCAGAVTFAQDAIKSSPLKLKNT